MDHLGLRPAKDHPHYIESVHISWFVEAAHPVSRRLGHLTLLARVNGAQWAAIGSGNTGLYLDEGD